MKKNNYYLLYKKLVEYRIRKNISYDKLSKKGSL